MKESASPPRTPTASHSPNDQMKSLSPLIPDDNSNSSMSSANNMLTPTFVLPQASDDGTASGKSQLDIEFPKLTPPKQKIWNTSPTINQSKSSNVNSNLNSNSSNSGCGGSSAKNLGSFSSSSSYSGSSNGSNNNNNVNVNSDNSSSSLLLLSEDNYESHNAATFGDTQNKRSSSLSTCSSSGSAANLQLQNTAISSTSSSTSTLINCDNNNDSNNNTKISIDTTQSHADDTQMAMSKSPNFINISSDSNNNSNNNNNKVSSQHQQQQQQHHSSVKNKPPLKAMGSSSSVEGGGTSSGFISRDSSSEQFTDQSGIDLVQFFKETLNKNAKDRNMLMKIERDLMSLATENS
jgi:encore-like protein